MNNVRFLNAVAVLLALAAAALILGGAALWIAQRPAFDFVRIEVRGELQHVTAASVRAAIAGRLRGNYFTMRLDDTRRLFETVPWVARAGVRRVWPNRLRVELIEYRALGSWDDGRLLSDSGELFVANSAEAEIFGPLASFSGPPAVAPEAARRYYEFATALAVIALTVDTIDVSERRSWSLQASGAGVPATRVELGRDEAARPLQQRLADVVAAYPMMVARVGGPPQRIDARYSNGIAASAPVPKANQAPLAHP
ncbi:MAG: cell division protein FtsQ/DivIB [Burkholderiaceae bacterium]